jgi:hypothetical protein
MFSGAMPQPSVPYNFTLYTPQGGLVPFTFCIQNSHITSSEVNPLAYLSCQAVFKGVYNLGAEVGWQVVMFLNLMLFYKRLVVLLLT